MASSDIKLDLKYAWWVKPCVFALVVTNRLLNHLAEKGTEVVPPKKESCRQHVIVRLHNQGSDIGVKGVLFIDWDDGVTTALEANGWTWGQLEHWQRYKLEGEPIYRFGNMVGKPLPV